MLSRLRALSIALALIVATCFSGEARAEIPRELAGRPIVAVEIAGETSAIAPAREVGIPLGAPLNRAVLRAAIARLVASGRWTDVQVDAVESDGGVRLIVWLKPRLVLHRVDVVGNEAIDEQAIRDALRVAEGSELTTDHEEELTRRVAKLYADRGYLGAQVELELRDTDDPSLKVLRLRIEEGAPTRIRFLRFAGEQPLDAVTALSAMESQVGDVLDRRTLDEDVARVEDFLRRRGFYEAALSPPLVTIQGEDAYVDIPTRIGPRYSFEIRGQEPFNIGDLYDALGLATERLTLTMLRQTLSARVIDYYKKRGFVGTTVEIQRFAGPKPGTAVLRVLIARGEQLRVVGVTFAGARHFDRDFLRDQLFSYLSEELPGSTLAQPVDSEVVDAMLQGRSARVREVPLPEVRDPEQFYYEPAYAKATEHIAELYRDDGYLAARVGPPQLVQIAKERAAVLIPVAEGPRTLLHEVVVRGAKAMSTRDVLVAAGLRRAEPFSYRALEQARRRLIDAYRDRGYAFAKVTPAVRFSGDRTRAEVELQVVEAFPVHIDRIVVNGADRTSGALIMRVLKIEPGDLWRPALARESERELATLGIFTGVSVALENPELPARVKSVIVTVSERKSQFLDFSAGLSTGQGIRGGFEYGYRNLFGQAVSTALRVQLAYQVFFVDQEIEERFDQLRVQDRLERRITLGTTIPRLPFLGRVRTSIDLVHLRDNERDFGLDQNAVGLTFTHSPAPHLTLTLGGDLENNRVDLFAGQALRDYLQTLPPGASTRKLLRVPDGSSTLIGARTSASYDRRDSAFTPTTGYFLSTSLEIARTLTGDPDELETMKDFVSRYFKISITGSGYIPIGHSVVLAGQARAGRIFKLTKDSVTYPNRAFFLGGVDTMRGYLEDELIPQDLVLPIEKTDLDPNTVVRSGDAFVLFRGEVRFPIYRELRGGVFADVGNLWANADALDPFDLRPTAGVGLRLNTPVGPIALDWGFNLDPREALEERSNALHFSIGLF